MLGCLEMGKKGVFLFQLIAKLEEIRKRRKGYRWNELTLRMRGPCLKDTRKTKTALYTFFNTNWGVSQVQKLAFLPPAFYFSNSVLLMYKVYIPS